MRRPVGALATLGPVATAPGLLRSLRARSARTTLGTIRPPLTLAETASVFGEMLTFRRMLANAGRKERKAMLAAKVEDMINTVIRQIAFVASATADAAATGGASG